MSPTTLPAPEDFLGAGGVCTAPVAGGRAVGRGRLGRRRGGRRTRRRRLAGVGLGVRGLLARVAVGRRVGLRLGGVAGGGASGAAAAARPATRAASERRGGGGRCRRARGALRRRAPRERRAVAGVRRRSVVRGSGLRGGCPWCRSLVLLRPSSPQDGVAMLCVSYAADGTVDYAYDVSGSSTVKPMREIPGAWHRTAAGAGLVGADGSIHPTIFAEMSRPRGANGRDQPRSGLPRRGRTGRSARGGARGDRARRQPVSAGPRHPGSARGRSPSTSSASTGCALDPARDVLVTAGATEALAATLLALVDGPDDEVVVFEPLLRLVRRRRRARRRAARDRAAALARLPARPRRAARAR